MHTNPPSNQHLDWDDWNLRLAHALDNLQQLDRFHGEVSSFLRDLAYLEQRRQGWKYDGSEVAQMAWLEFAQTFRDGKVPCESVEKLIPVLRRLLKDAAAEKIRHDMAQKRGQGKVQHLSDWSQLEMPDPEAVSPSLCARTQEEQDLLTRAIAQLKDPHLQRAAEKVRKHWTHETLSVVMQYEKHLETLSPEEQEATRDQVKQAGKRLYKKLLRELRPLMGGASDDSRP